MWDEGLGQKSFVESVMHRGLRYVCLKESSILLSTCCLKSEI